MIFAPFERMVAFRYLRARRQEGFISVIAVFSLLGIALGVATLIIVMSVMNGFRAELLGRILGLNGHLGIYGTAGPLPDFDALAGKIRGVPGVTAVIPQVEGQVMATVNNVASGAVVRGQRVEDLRDHSVIGSHILEGSLDKLDEDSVVIGTRMALKLRVSPGDEITLI